MDKQNNVYITELNQRDEGGDNTISEHQNNENAESDQEELSNQIFNVMDAVPPTDFEAPYSSLPSSVNLKKVKQKVKYSYKNIVKAKQFEINQKNRKKLENPIPKPKKDQKEEVKLPDIKSTQIQKTYLSNQREKKEHWLNLLDLEHADALISDAFWYAIIELCNPKAEFDRHKDWLLDRMAANFVSFTLIEDERFGKESMEQFFKKFYDIISQAVYYSLFYAYPKSRKSLDENFMRKLIQTFSEIFTGTQIHSASLNHWDDVGASAFVQKSGAGVKGKDPSLADYDINKKTKSRRQVKFMRYSPLVERYLLNHNYETINNVIGWKMKLTQRSEIQKDVDKKFKKFKQILNNAVQTKSQLLDNYGRFCKQIDQDLAKCKEQADQFDHYLMLVDKEKKESGLYMEFANLVASLARSQHINAGEDDKAAGDQN